MNRLSQILCLFIACAAFAVWGVQVHVVWQTSADGLVKEQGDTLVNSEDTYTTCEAPRIDGYVFTGWTIDTKQELKSRDAWGRSFDSVSITVFEPTVLTANYHLESVDSDGDGLSDARELYWYGNLDQDHDSVTDGDGIPLSREFAQGLNPHLANRSFKGIVSNDGILSDYNPNGYPKCVVRCEPDGELFATMHSFVKPGNAVTTPEFDPFATRFAYWSINGVRQVDPVGQALNVVAFAMPEDDVEVVAVCDMCSDDRARLHWYGDDTIALASDTDNDGRTLEEELAAGTNPLLKDRTVSRGVTFAQSETVDYNPLGYRKLSVLSDPEGALFAASTRYVAVGSHVASPNCRYGDGFMGWTVNGERQQDVLGRALDQVTFDMPDEDVELVASGTTDAEEQMQIYWYGNELISPDSDTDGDGYALATEVSAGTNPLLKDRTLAKGVAFADALTREVDIQPYEQATGAVVGGKFTELFTSPVSGNSGASRTFADGAQIWPVVGDVNDDGLWDLIIVGERSTNVLINVGSRGNPEFEDADPDSVSRWPDLQMNSTEKLHTMSLDVEPIGALSATTYDVTTLVSDDEGRIWCYTMSVELDGFKWKLRHKVWGGSHAGFADGLMLAAVDWDDDGDLDCLCGTAEGKLMLLRDPKVGRPTNLRASAGVDNVKLDWDPNQQSRIRGYRVYRADEAKAEGEQWNLLASPSLPTYRDYPPSVSDFDYKVSSVSRHYVAGNSAPIVSESPATEAVRASLGKVELMVDDAFGYAGSNIAVTVSINNSQHVSAEGLRLELSYDIKKLKMSGKVEPTGLTDSIKYDYDNDPDSGVIVIVGKSGEIAASKREGSEFFILNFTSSGALTGTNETQVTLNSAVLKSISGSASTVPGLPKSGTVTIVAENRKYPKGDVNGDGKVDTMDLKLLIWYTGGGFARAPEKGTPQFDACDVDETTEQRGILNGHDVDALKAMLKEKGLL